ncbi:hypothetical protein A2U01_0096640, partial [Trifolium medium]|nr:hypothetical protein [Trifolium medium]
DGCARRNDDTQPVSRKLSGKRNRSGFVN